MIPKLLVTGASGFLGWNICQVAKSEWEVYGTYNSSPVTDSGVKFIKTDLTVLGDLKEVWEEIKPDAVIHAAAASKPNFCEENPDISHKINVVAAGDMASLCGAAGIPYVFTSTDLVFDGLNPPYRETDLVCPINTYGGQKVKAEGEILARYPKAAICRMPLMYGIASPHGGSFIQGFIKTLKSGNCLNLFEDEFRTPVSGTTAARGLLLAIEKKVNGILHLGGKQRISRYEFGLLMAQVLDLPADRITPGKQQDVKSIAPRSPDTSLDSSQAFDLGYQPPSIMEELAALRGLV